MFRRAFRVVASVGVGALVLGSLAVPSDASNLTQARTQAQGVTDDEILIVALVPDLDELRARGINLAAKLTTGQFLKRWQGYADAFGPINGRKVVVKAVGWNPTDATSQSTSCIKAVQDNKPFLVVNASGYRAAYIPCITVDNNTPMISGDPGYGAVAKASGNKLLNLGLPSETAGSTTAQFVAKAGLVPKSAKIGILSNNDPQIKAAGDVLEAELEERGYDVVQKIELNGLAADATLIAREGATAVTTMKAAGVDTVFLPQAFIALGGFFEEVARSNAGFKMFALDGQAATCTMDSAARAPAAAVGTPCITVNDTRSVATKDGVKPDNDFEAKCREQFDDFMGETSVPGAPNGDVTVNGVNYTEDFAFAECTISSLLYPAMKKAGKKLTWDKVHANLIKTTKAPAAYLSNGEGGFAKNKPYFTNQVHLVTLTGANETTAKDANGTFNGCTIPRPCWVPSEVDGKEWFPIAGAAKN
jgi:hypothetical protein